MTITLRTLLLGISAIGTALFSAALITSFLNPGYVEDIAKDIIKVQVENTVHEKIESLNERFLSSKAASLLKSHSDEIENINRQLNEKLPERIANVIAEMRDLNCECRKQLIKSIHDGIELHIAELAAAQDQLTNFIRAKYMSVAEKLTREFRIFTGTNAVVFALLGIGAFFKRGAGIHLIPPAFVMLVAAAITGYLYIFKQDWLHTILFCDYIGFMYVGYLSIVFAILCDILFNKARLTTELLNITFQVIGSSLHVIPC